MWLNPQKTVDLVTFTEEILKRLSHARNFFNVMLTGGTWFIYSLTLPKFSRVYDAACVFYIRLYELTERRYENFLPFKTF